MKNQIRIIITTTTVFLPLRAPFKLYIRREQKRKVSKSKMADHSCSNAANFINVPTFLKLYLLVPTFTNVPTFWRIYVSALSICVWMCLLVDTCVCFVKMCLNVFLLCLNVFEFVSWQTHMSALSKWVWMCLLADTYFSSVSSYIWFFQF